MIYWIGFVVMTLIWLYMNDSANKQREKNGKPMKMYWPLLVFLWLMWSLYYYVQTYTGWLPRVW